MACPRVDNGHKSIAVQDDGSQPYTARVIPCAARCVIPNSLRMRSRIAVIVEQCESRPLLRVMVAVEVAAGVLVVVALAFPSSSLQLI